MSDDTLKASLENMLRDMARKVMPLVSKGPGTMFRLSFTKNEAKAEFFMGDALVLQFTFNEGMIEDGEAETKKPVPPGKN
jgi:hypothetical protein